MEDRRAINGMAYKTRTGVSWRDLPEGYGPWRQAVYTRFRRYALDGVFTRALHRPGSPARCRHRPKEGEAPAGRTGRSRPRPIPRRTDSDDRCGSGRV
ncbi:transposase [Streptomyces sp. BBFR109]|uniref:transposase n=1 Tax=Streptomyces sp. BBFR109 TaxID=3448172 RepID=UPI003F773894